MTCKLEIVRPFVFSFKLHSAIPQIIYLQNGNGINLVEFLRQLDVFMYIKYLDSTQHSTQETLREEKSTLTAHTLNISHILHKWL